MRATLTRVRSLPSQFAPGLEFGRADETLGELRAGRSRRRRRDPVAQPDPVARAGRGRRRGRRSGRDRRPRSAGRALSIRSRAAIQLPTGPAHMIGITPLKRMSPAKQTRASGSQAIASPTVWAGPTKVELDRAPADVELGRVGERPVGNAWLDPLELVVGEQPVEGARGRASARPRASSGIRPSSACDARDGRHPGQHRGRLLAHLADRRARTPDRRRRRSEQAVAVPVVAVAVGVEELPRSARRPRR